MNRVIKKSILFILALVSACSIFGAAFTLISGKRVSAATQDKGIINVYLIAGQSNAVGYGKDHTGEVVNLEPRFAMDGTGVSNVLYYGEQERWDGSAEITGFAPIKLGFGCANDRAGAEIGIASALKDTDTMNAVIKCAWGATHLYPDEVYNISYQQGTWTSPSYIKENNVSLAKNDMIGRMYTWWTQTVTRGISMLIEDGYTPVIKGLWWMQGEAEMSKNQMASVYDELLTALIGDMRNSLSEITGYDCSATPFVFGLPIWNLNNSGTPPYQLDVRENMQAVADNVNILNVDCTDCAGLFQHDSWHFDARGQKYLGEQFIAKLANLNEQGETLKEEISIFEGPSIRLEAGKQGLKFGAKIVNYNKANNYKYGTVILPTDYLTDNGIKGDYINELAKKDLDIINLSCDVNTGDYNGDGLSENYIQGTITDIKYKNLNREFTGIAYIVDENGNYAYSAPRKISLAKLASQEIFNYNTDSEEYQKLYSYLNGAVNFANGVAEKDMANPCDFSIVTDNVITLELGEKIITKKLNVTQSPAMDFKVKYLIEDTEIATIDENGVLTPKAYGETKLTIVCMGKTKDVTICVTAYIVDGISIDGVKDSNYGTTNILNKLDGDRSYSISAVKTDSGVFIYSQLIANTNVSSSNNWYENTNFEFKLNGESSVQSYVNTKKQSVGVTQFAYTTEKLASGKTRHTAEMFIEKSQIANWSDTNGVQLNYAWKTPGETAILLTDALDYRYYTEWGAQDWHAFHRLGGLLTNFNPYVNNLLVTTNGLSYATNEAIDGVISASEYPTKSLTKSNANIQVKMQGKVADGDLYLAFTITHNAWSATDIGKGNWWKNDNLEMSINGQKAVIMFYNGELILPSHYTCGKAVTTNGENNKLVTVLELYIKGDCEAYKVQLGLNGTQFAWLGFMWDQYFGTVTSSGVYIAGEAITLGNGVKLDGVLDDSIYTSQVKTNVVTTTANGASITLMGTKTADGVYIASTIVHTKAPEVSTDGSNNWYTFLNMEYRLNNKTGYQILLTCKGLSANTAGFGSSKTTTGGDGKYTTIFEMYVPNSSIGVTASQTNVALNVGGWFETAFARLFGASDWTATHNISATGITPIA